ncbi:MAG: hypothetical protein ACJAXG_000558 [Celeribacter sp.]|jgi:hypothetical protein
MCNEKKSKQFHSARFTPAPHHQRAPANLPFFAHCRTQGFPAHEQADRLQKKNEPRQFLIGQAV